MHDSSLLLPSAAQQKIGADELFNDELLGDPNAQSSVDDPNDDDIHMSLLGDVQAAESRLAARIRSSEKRNAHHGSLLDPSSSFWKRGELHSTPGVFFWLRG